MNTDELLASFRSDFPVPDETTAKRIYVQATAARRQLARRRLILAIALVAAAGIVGALSVTLFGGVKHPQNGDLPFIPVTNLSFARDGHTVTSISFTVGDDLIPNAMLAIEVIRAHPTSPAGPTGQESVVNGTVVFEERAPMTNTGSTTPSTAVATWSGTLYPREWDGGCQDGLYYIQATVYSAVLSSDNPFDPGTMNRYDATGWFRCSSS